MVAYGKSVKENVKGTAQHLASNAQPGGDGITQLTPTQVSEENANQLQDAGYQAPQQPGQPQQSGSSLAQSILQIEANPPSQEEARRNQEDYAKRAAGLAPSAATQNLMQGPDFYSKYKPSVAPAVGEAEVLKGLSAEDVAEDAAEQKNTINVIDTNTFEDMVEVPESISARASGQTLSHSAEAIEAMRKKEKKEEEEAEEEEGKKEEKPEELPVDDPQNSALTTGAPQFRPAQGPITEQVSTKVAQGTRKQSEQEVKSEVKKRVFGGVAVTDKLGGDATLGMRTISVGRDIIEEVLRIPDSGLLQRLKDELGVEFDPSSPTFVKDVIFTINSNNIRVASTKPPVNALSSYQSRVLRVHTGRGIRLHPIMAKLYNADYDGDDISASFVMKFSRRAVDPMSTLFNQKGELLIDPAFFPWATLVGNMPFEGMDQTYEDYMKNVAFERRTKEEKEYLANLLGKYCGETKNLKLREKYLADYMRGIINVASRYHNTYEVAADILKDTYDGLHYLSAIQFQQLDGDVRETFYDDMPEAESDADYAILKITEDLVIGKNTINFQAFKEKMMAYVGEGGDNKNLAFRFTANIAKMFRFDDKLVFESDEDFYEVYSQLMAYVASKKISNAEYAAFRAKAAGETLRKAIIDKVGFPGDALARALKESGTDRITPKFASDVFMQWLHDFVIEYQNMSAAINLANRRLYSDFDIEFGGKDLVKSIDGVTIGDAITPFIQVFGNYSMWKVFGDVILYGRRPKEYKMAYSGKYQTGEAWIEELYKDKSVSEFSKYNKIASGQKARYDASKRKALGNKNLGNFEDFINSLANHKTSSASAFNMQVYTAPDSMCARILEVMKDLKNILAECERVGSVLPLNEASDTIIECLRAFGGEMFDHFNMSNMKGFLESKYGQRLLDAKDPNEVGGIRMTMLVDAAMSRIDSEVGKRDELIKAKASTSRLMKADNAVTAEINEFANRSAAYRAIAKELTVSADHRGWENIIKMSRENPGKRMFRTLYGYSPFWNDDGVMRGTGVTYWDHPTHDGLLDFLMDVDVGADVKRCVLADVVRWHEKYDSMTQYEVSAMLEEDNSPSFTSMKAGAKSIFDITRDFRGRYNSWAKRKREDLRKDIEKARENHKGNLRDYFKFLADNPEMHVQLPDDVFYDALNSALDKQYGQSEKSKQHSAVNALYAALSYCLHGGIFSDVYRTDDRVLGQQSYEKISYQDLARLFAYPGEELRVYDKYGQPVTLTAEKLIGVPNPKESDVWEWMLAHPNVAAGFRMHRMHVKNFGNGGAFTAVDRSLDDSMSHCLSVDMTTEEHLREKALYKLRDRPGFGALVSGLSETYNKPSRLMRQEYKKAERLALELVFKFAVIKRETGDFPLLTLKDGKGFSLTQNVRSEEWTKSIEDKVTGDKTVLKEDANSMDSSIQETLQACAIDLLSTKLAGSVDLVEAFESTGALKSGEINLTDAKYQIKDKQSFSAYFDVRQELNGAKTQISVGVEGTTSHLLFPWVALLAPKDKYADFTNIPREDWALLKGARTNIRDSVGIGFVTIGDGLGKDQTIEDHIQELIDIYGENFVVEVPDGYIVKDKTSSTNPNKQLCTVVSWLMTKRDDGAEAHNLKIKKFGVDKYNSITKFDKYTDVGNLLEEVKKAYRSETDPKMGRIVATQYLAEVIKQANEDLEYNDMTLANCMCIADLMILETQDERTLVLRSIEQLATAIKHQLPADMVDRAVFKELSEAAQAIADQVGLHEVVNPNEVLANVRVSAKSWFHPVINETASSFERNFDLLDHIVKATKVGVHSDAWLEDRAQKLLNANKKMFGKEKSSLKFWGAYKPIGIVGSTYHQAPGMNAMLVLDSEVVDGKPLDEEIVNQAMDTAYRFGNTVYVGEDCVKYLKPKLRENLVPFKDGFILPMFDIRLNGMYDHTDGGAWSIFQAHPDRAVTMYEDELNEFKLGDSMAIAFNALKNRLKPRWNTTWEIRKEDLFKNALRDFPDASVEMSFASSVTIEKFIVNGFPEEFELDYGMPQGTPGFEDHKKRIDALINEYRMNYQYADINGQMKYGNRAGQIVGWVEAKIYDRNKMAAPKKVLAPIIPFDMRGKMSAPTRYDVDSLTIDEKFASGYSTINLNCHFVGDLDDQYVKMHEGAGAANKMMMWFAKKLEGLNLWDGTPIDGCYAAATTSSRRGGTDRRIKTMETMMFFARKRKYNFAEVEGSFPDDKELKEALKSARLNREFWEEEINGQKRINLYFDGKYKFHENEEINAFLVSEIRKFWDNGGTPSDYLANRFITTNDQGKQVYYTSNIYWEFSCMFEQSYKYQDMWMKFHHMMDADLCPNGFNDLNATGDELFSPVVNKDSFEEHGVMRMLIPRRSWYNPNKIFWKRGCVFTGWSFFGEDFSAMKKPSVNGSESTMETQVTTFLAGINPSDGDELRRIMQYSQSDLSEIENAAMYSMDMEQEVEEA